MKVDLSFQGWVRGANITSATNVKGETIDVTNMPDLIEKLNKGELFVSLADALEDNKDSEIEIFDFQE